MDFCEFLAIFLTLDQFIETNVNAFTTVHPWCGNHFTSISACGMWGVGGKGRGSSIQEGVSHIYTLRLG